MAKTAGKQSSTPSSQAQTPAPGDSSAVVATTTGNDGPVCDGPSAPRPMRLKVLYSLDDNMPNCLARAKEVAHVRVVYIDPDTPIGLVDLKTCVLNITYSSPEILHHHGCDYSVYVFDYTEPETPMIGLGLLSWVLSLPALNGTKPDAEDLTSAQANRLVSGRVQKNLLGLFAGDVKETLEVRMRLCRVPGLKQAEYVNQMHQYSNLSKSMPQGIDVASWWTNGMINAQQQGMNAQAQAMGLYHPQNQGGYQPGPHNVAPGPSGPPIYGQTYPYPYQQAQQQNSPEPYSGQPTQNHNQPLFPPQQYYPQPNPVTQPAPQAAPSQANIAPPRPSSPSIASAPTPAPPSQSHPPSERDESPSGPTRPPIKKRKVALKRSTSTTIRAPRGRPRKQSLTSGPASETSVPPLNRTVSEPVQYQPSPPPAVSIEPSPVLPKSTLVRKASVAEKMEKITPELWPVEKPLPPTFPLPHPASFSRPSPSEMSSAAPSPVALVPTTHPDHRSVKSPPVLSLAPALSITMRESPHRDTSNQDNMSTDLPEDDGDTDIDSLFIGSSPPPTSAEMREDNSPSPVGATSPVLPEPHFKDTARQINSRRTSEVLQEVMSREQSPEDRFPPPQSDFAVPDLPVKALPSKADETLPMSDQVDAAAQALKKPRKKYPRKPRKKDRTSDAGAPSTDIPEGPPPPKRKKGRPPTEKPEDYRVITTKERIEQKMKEKIAAGEMPNFCVHCGQIETPTWRKVKIRVPPVDSEDSKDQWTEQEILLCNPCGLWHHNHGTMRPESFWDQPEEDKPRPTRKPRASRKKSAAEREEARAKRRADLALKKEIQTQMASSSAWYNQEQTQPMIIEVNEDDNDDDDNENNHNTSFDNDNGSNLLTIESVVPRSLSSPPPETAKDRDWVEATNRDVRRVQSSPLPTGTIVDPICLVSPEQKNTRRILFPGAKKTGLSFSQGFGVSEPDVAPSMELVRKGDDRSSPSEGEVDELVTDKENHPPVDVHMPEGIEWQADIENELRRGLQDVAKDEGADVMIVPRPTTPTNQSEAMIRFKTPTKFTPHLGSMSSASPWKAAIFAGMTPTGKSALATPGNKMPGSASKLISPASGEIMIELLEQWNQSNDGLLNGSNGMTAEMTANMNLFSDLDIDFEMNEHDFLMTSDHPMPSSPPAIFSLYDEGPPGLVDASSSMWSDMMPSSPGLNGVVGNYTLNLFGDSSIHGGHDKEMDDMTHTDLDLELDDNLIVDFADFISSTTNLTKNVASVDVPENGAVTNPTEGGQKESSTNSEDGSSSADGK